MENQPWRNCKDVKIPLIAVAHGSRDRCAGENVVQLIEQVKRFRPEIEIHLCFLEHTKPSFFRVIELVSGSPIVVPLLLSRGYHVSVDIQKSCIKHGLRFTPPLGPDPILSEVISERLREAGAPFGTPVLLAAAGSRFREGIEDVELVAGDLRNKLLAPIKIGYLNSCNNPVAEAADKLRSEFGEFAIAPYLLSSGNFKTLANSVAAQWTASPLGSNPKIADLILKRYDHELAVDGSQNLIAR